MIMHLKLVFGSPVQSGLLGWTELMWTGSVRSFVGLVTSLHNFIRIYIYFLSIYYIVQ